jgi:hypothetical protein
MSSYFDPDRWYQTERTLLETRRERRELDDHRYSEALQDLEWRYDEMVSRIGRAFRGAR